MPMTLVQTVSVFTSSVSINSIPQTGKDILILADLRVATNTTNATMSIRVNNDTGSNYSTRRLRGQPAVSTSSDFQSNDSTPRSAEIPGDTTGTTTYGSLACYIPNYATSAPKIFSLDTISPSNTNNMPSNIVAQGWNSTSPITSIRIDAQGGNTMQGSISLYIIS